LCRILAQAHQQASWNPRGRGEIVKADSICHLVGQGA
jgi:hypothetical protein